MLTKKLRTLLVVLILVLAVAITATAVVIKQYDARHEREEAVMIERADMDKGTIWAQMEPLEITAVATKHPTTLEGEYWTSASAKKPTMMTRQALMVQWIS